jgi:hypothetical protein
MEIQGVIPAKIEPVGEYRLKSLEEVVYDIRARLKAGAPMSDWWINQFWFTQMNIQNLSLRYRLGVDNYMFPVYAINGTYSFDYGNTHENGGISGMLVAVSENNRI